MAYSEIINQLARKNITAISNISAAKCTTIGAGGCFPLLIKPKNIEELTSLFAILDDVGISYRILGNGSNLLVSDAGITEVVIQLAGTFKNFSIEDTAVQVGGGYSLPLLARAVSNAGLSGFEFGGGIPASIGGAIKMNAGAHGAQIANILRSITVITNGKIAEIPAAELNFSYRSSTIPPNAVIVKATFDLCRGETEVIHERLQRNLAERRKHQPLMHPSFGSVFKNPDGKTGSAGALIEKAGLKGHTFGGAQISGMHANWIVNQKKNALASEVYSLITLAQATVADKFQIPLHPEVILWGPF